MRSLKLKIISISGFILCNCDSPECLAAGQKECKAEFYCYVSFRPAKADERKAAASKLLAHGAGSQLFIADHRGCATAASQFELCNEHGSGSPASSGGGFGNLNGGDDKPRPVVRCCRDNWCNIGQVSLNLLSFPQTDTVMSAS